MDIVLQITGFAVWIIVVSLGMLKKLRDDKRVRLIIMITACIAVYPVCVRIIDFPFRGYARDSDTLFMPLVYILSYALLRWSYKKIYRREPTYYRYSFYDPEDKREQNFLDVIVYIAPMLLSIIFFVYLNDLWPQTRTLP